MANTAPPNEHYTQAAVKIKMPQAGCSLVEEKLLTIPSLIHITEVELNELR